MCGLMRSRTDENTDTFLCWKISVQPRVLQEFHSRTSLAIGVTFGVLCWNKTKTLFLIWQAGTWAILCFLFNSASSFHRTLVLFHCKKENPLKADLISWGEEKQERGEAYSPTFFGIVWVKTYCGKDFPDKRVPPVFTQRPCIPMHNILFSESLNTTNNHALVSTCLAYLKNPSVMALNPDLWLFLSDAKMIISAGSQFDIREQLVKPLILHLDICCSYRCPSCFCIQFHKDRFTIPTTIEMCLSFRWY